MPLRLVSLDLDGTLIHPAIFNAVADAMGFGEPLQRSYEAYVSGEMTLEQAFHHDFAHFVGRDVQAMRDVLDRSEAWTAGIEEAVARFHAAGVRVIVTTDQPRFLAEATLRFGVDAVVCSEADLRHGRVTDAVYPSFNKWQNLERHLRARRVDPADVAHVGNGTNDIPVFQKVGLAVAVNALDPSVSAAAVHDIPELQDLNEVADILLNDSS